MGLVSSNRRLHSPPNSSARPKLSMMLLAWPTCRYPLGSGGKRVRTRPLYLPLALSARTESRIKLERGESRSFIKQVLEQNRGGRARCPARALPAFRTAAARFFD